jgi:hypothetical protein
MDAWIIIPGVLFVIWPLQYRWSTGRIQRRLSQRGGDIERLRSTMDHSWIRASLMAFPALGVVLIIVGLTS